MPQQGNEFASSSTRLDSSAESLDAQQVAPLEGIRHWLVATAAAVGHHAVTLRFPVTTLALAVGLAACLMYTVTHLGYRSSRLDLLNPKSDYNRLWMDYINEFGEEDDAVIVVEGPGREQVVPVLVELSASLGKKKRLFHAILDEDLSKIVPSACTRPGDGFPANDRLLSMPTDQGWMVAAASRQNHCRDVADGKRPPPGAARNPPTRASSIEPSRLARAV